GVGTPFRSRAAPTDGRPRLRPGAAARRTPKTTLSGHAPSQHVPGHEPARPRPGRTEPDSAAPSAEPELPHETGEPSQVTVCYLACPRLRRSATEGGRTVDAPAGRLGPRAI